MKQLNPYELFKAEEGSLEEMPCSILALGLSLKAFNKTAVDDLDVKIGKDGYCRLNDINKSIRKQFKVKAYKYLKQSERKKLGEYQKFPGRYIVCVKGHYVYAEDDSYYSFFDNSEDEVIAYWLLDSVLTKTHVLSIKDEYKVAIDNNLKRFEVRKDDRNFQVGDFIHFVKVDKSEFEQDKDNKFRIIYKLDGVPAYGLMTGYCVLGIERE